MPHPAAFPPILAIVAVLACAGLFIWFYQALFPRPARWLLVGLAFPLGIGVTALYVWLLAPRAAGLGAITDTWSALRMMVLAAGLPEEAVKLTATAAAMLVCFRGLRPAEAFQASLFAALGFAAIENAHYARMFPEIALPVAIGRGIAASFVHSMMGMMQGFFLAELVRSGWRRWHLPVLGYLVAAVAHALFNWGLIRPVLEYLQTKQMRIETITQSLWVAVPCILAVIALSITLFCWELRRSAREDPITSEAAHQKKVARWHRTGDVMIVVGGMGFIGSLVLAFFMARALEGQPQPTELADVTPENLRASAIMTVAVAVSPVVALFGVLVRNKQ
ncbi:PrsW family glutamic-type intramembrane protease [Dongia sp.]|uniref:PrsW family glutamic-type intramembrane protease n=1 Tax=Dongia sp. TaxID=1977262 RepID=UPI00375355C9